MKIKLSYFLSKRKTTLEKYCDNNQIGDYDTLVRLLSDEGIEAPLMKRYSIS